MKFFLTLFVIAAIGDFNVKSQDLVASGIAPNMYLTHKVAPKESWFSIGRLYNVNARELATYNALNLEKGLIIAQVIKIPLTAQNTIEVSNAPVATEFLVPYYHIVEKSEGLYRIAINAGKKLEEIKNFNNLQSDALNTGAKIIVGYLRLKRGESAFISKAVQTPVVITAPKETVKTEPPAEPTLIPKEVPVKDTVIKKANEITTAKEVEKPKAPMVEVKEIPETVISSEGFFKKDFQQNNKKEISGLSAVFKTTSGWTDNKYYALLDGVNSGTIVQITNKKNGKVVYAKVLGEMQEIKQNTGLLMRISNATANALNALEDTIEVKIKY